MCCCNRDRGVFIWAPVKDTVSDKYTPLKIPFFLPKFPSQTHILQKIFTNVYELEKFFLKIVLL
jgi:hypothetical protein